MGLSPMKLVEFRMDWLEHKYIGILSTRLERFQRKGPSLYNFRCPLCGDSGKNKTKARAYIYENKKQNKTKFHCHNCGNPMDFKSFLKTMDQNLYNQMQMERLQDNKTPQQLDLENFVNKMKKPVFRKSGPLKNLKKVSQLSPEHPVKKFITKRQIPTKFHAKLFSCPNFMTFTNTLIPGKFKEESLNHDETRLLIPFLDEEQNVFAYQGRTLGPSDVKYITIVLDDSKPKVWGLDSVDWNKKVYVFEGPIDAMFIDNSIATGGGDLVSTVHTLDKTNMVIVYDNEKRSKETVKKIDKAILNGYNVCFWPEYIEQKDVNDMVLSGTSPEEIKKIIDANTYSGLAGRLMLTKWSKI